MENIKDLIYEIRGKQVMLDSDVGRLYNYNTKRINEIVKRNKERFPGDFYFQLNEVEYFSLKSQTVTSDLEEKTPANIETLFIDDMRSQFATASTEKRNARYLPYVFTEKGIVMLAGLLKNNVAITVSLNIVEAFVKMRAFINNNKNLFERVISIENKIDDKFLNYDSKFEEIFNELQRDIGFKQKIFYDGQIYDAYSLIIDIIKKAEKEIVIIDNYVNKDVLDMLSNKKNGVKVIIKSSNKLSDLDINKFNEQYPLLESIKSNKYHDRFIIIDSIEIYHLGASLKDAGKKCFAISKLEDNYFIENIKG